MKDEKIDSDQREGLFEDHNDIYNGNPEYKDWSDEWDEWYDEGVEENQRAKYRKQNKKSTDW